jgi:hypothetical protein
VLFLCGLWLPLLACETRQIRNESLWYTVSVPKTWSIKNNMIDSGQGDTMKVVRLPDDAPLENLIESTRRSIQMEMTGFETETEDTLKIQGNEAWRIIGTFRPSKDAPESTLIKVLINAGKYKYVIDILTPAEQYKERKKIFEQAIQSFTFEIPKY